MRLMLISLVSILFIFLACASGEKEPKNLTLDDMIKKYPKNVKLLFTNDYVGVSNFVLKSGEAMPVHAENERIIYSLTDCKLEWLVDDNKPEMKQWKMGEVHWSKGRIHSTRNLRDNDVSFLVVSRRDSALTIANGSLDKDVTSVAPEFSKVLLDNEFAKVVDVKIPYGKAVPQHEGINRLIYALNDYQINFSENGSDMSKKEFKTGDMHWHVGGTHAIENIGETEAHYLIFSFKK